MEDMPTSPSGLDIALSRFPQSALRLRKLALADQEFRSLCEDLGLACESLARLERQAGMVDRPELDEYRHVIAELEQEISTLLLISDF